MSGLVPLNFTDMIGTNLSDYRPSGIVKFFHAFPHWSQTLKGESPEFKVKLFTMYLYIIYI